ncbi:hypothetical protein ACJX0J_017669, partial [Zea mays]
MKHTITAFMDSEIHSCNFNILDNIHEVLSWTNCRVVFLLTFDTIHVCYLSAAIQRPREQIMALVCDYSKILIALNFSAFFMGHTQLCSTAHVIVDSLAQMFTLQLAFNTELFTNTAQMLVPKDIGYKLFWHNVLISFQTLN